MNPDVVAMMQKSGTKIKMNVTNYIIPHWKKTYEKMISVEKATKSTAFSQKRTFIVYVFYKISCKCFLKPKEL